MDDEKDYFFDSDNEQSKDIIDGLRNLMISGCTLTELLNYVEAQLGDDIRYHTYSDYMDAAFNVFVRYVQHTSKYKHPLDLSILTGKFIPDIVANRDEWQPQENRAECWMDKIYTEPPSESDDSIPFDISVEGWNAISHTDQERLKTGSRSFQLAGYRSVVLSVLCEQLQLQLRELKKENSS